MLVVVHDGDVEGALQTLLNIEALGSLDVLQVDTSKGRGNFLYCLAELLGVFLVYLNVEHVDAAIYLEQEALAFHDGLAAHGADVTQSEYGCTVGDDSYQITLVGITVCVVGVFLNFQTGEGHARRVGEREVCLCAISLCRLYFDFAWPSAFMILEGGFFGDFNHGLLSFF